MPKSYVVTPDKPYFNGLLFGDPGSGKTSLAVSAQDHPKMADVLVINHEGGLLSVAHRGDIRAVDVHTTEELEDILIRLKQRDKEYKGIRTVIIDSATELQTVNLEEIVQREAKKKSGRNKNDIYRADYGESTVQLKRVFRGFRDIRRHVIFTALAKYVYPKMPEGADTTNVDPLAVIPSLTAKLASSLMGYVDFVWFCYYDKDEDKYRVLTQPEDAFFAKTRGPHFAKALGKLRTVKIDNLKGTGMPKIYSIWERSSIKDRQLVAEEEATPKPKPKATTNNEG